MYAAMKATTASKIMIDIKASGSIARTSYVTRITFADGRGKCPL